MLENKDLLTVQLNLRPVFEEMAREGTLVTIKKSQYPEDHSGNPRENYSNTPLEAIKWVHTGMLRWAVTKMFPGVSLAGVDLPKFFCKGSAITCRVWFPTPGQSKPMSHATFRFSQVKGDMTVWLEPWLIDDLGGFARVVRRLSGLADNEECGLDLERMTAGKATYAGGTLPMTMSVAELNVLLGGVK